MSEEKLTVAELLARAGREPAPAEGTRRRRRRSLEEGGISVADLTGGQPRIRGGEPRRGAHAAHAAEPDDETGQEPQETAPEQPADVAEPAAVRDDEPGEPAPAPAPEPEPEQEPEPETPAAARPVPEPRPRVTVSDHGMRAGVPLATPVSPAPVMEIPETGEITFTFTALHDAETSSQPVAEPGPMAKEALGVFAPAPAAQPEPEPAAEPEPAPKSVMSISRPEDPAPGEARTDVQDVIADEEPDAGEPEAAEPAAAAHTDVLPRAEEPEEPGEPEEPAAGAAPASRPRSARPAQREDDSLSYGLLAVQVLVGLLAGAALFLAFLFLWATGLPFVVKAVIGIAVAGLLVAGANALRRQQDTMTPILAGVVGLLLAFGPWLMSLF